MCSTAYFHPFVSGILELKRGSYREGVIEMAKILIADDDRDFRRILGRALQHEGFNVVIAGDGQEALALARTEKPDLMLLDVLMSRMYGTEVAAALREDRTTEHIPVIFLTGLKSNYDNLGIPCHDFGEVLAKPLDYVALISTIQDRLHAVDSF